MVEKQGIMMENYQEQYNQELHLNSFLKFPCEGES